MKTLPGGIHARRRDVFGLSPGETGMLATRFRGVDTPQDFLRLVRVLKSQRPVPVGVKVGVSDYIDDHGPAGSAPDVAKARLRHGTRSGRRPAPSRQMPQA